MADISLAWDASQFGPPGGCCNLLHSPHNTFIFIVKGGFGWAFLHSRVILQLSTQEFLHFGVQYRWSPKVSFFRLWPICCSWSLIGVTRWKEEVMHLYRLWPVPCLGGCFCVGVWTGILISDLPSGSHSTGWVCLPLGCIPRAALQWGCLCLGASWQMPSVAPWTTVPSWVSPVTTWLPLTTLPPMRGGVAQLLYMFFPA